MEAVRSSETSASTLRLHGWHYNPDGSHLHTCCHDNLISHIIIVVIISDAEPCEGQLTKTRVSTSGQPAVDFDCPEEFGYYPHPSDCTQYYVCVFGGPLLESCTGGLMYR
jgi:hypothetical protein